VTEFLQNAGKSVKSGNRNVWIPRDLRLDGDIPKLDVEGSSPFARFEHKYRRNHALDYLPAVGSAA
jgi:hypothetical protein